MTCIHRHSCKNVQNSYHAMNSRMLKCSAYPCVENKRTRIKLYSAMRACVQFARMCSSTCRCLFTSLKFIICVCKRACARRCFCMHTQEQCLASLLHHQHIVLLIYQYLTFNAVANVGLSAACMTY